MKNYYELYESEVRSYCRTFPTEFKYAKGSTLIDVEGRKYIDFFCGAGALNYGHNNPYIKEKLIEYLNTDGIIHSLDMYAEPKREFIKYFEEEVLIPRGLDYKIQFAGPTGTNAVEAALKLARKAKNRTNIFALMGCFHGMTLGSISLTSDKDSRKGAGVPLNNVTHIPTPYMFEGLDVIAYLDKILSDDHSGIELPAAIILETVQAEGGVYVFDTEFLKGIREICNKYDILMICDEIQIGNCRTGNFFSFERANIVPDIVTMSKSIGGIGLPLALTLIKKDLDIWKPGEHNGTFRGFMPAMITAKAGLEFMKNANIEAKVKVKEKIVKDYLEANVKGFDIRGIGLIWGIDVFDEKLSKTIVAKCFENGLVLERAGRNNSVVKLMPALTIEENELKAGLEILVNAIHEVTKK